MKFVQEGNHFHITLDEGEKYLGEYPSRAGLVPGDKVSKGAPEILQGDGSGMRTMVFEMKGGFPLWICRRFDEISTVYDVDGVQLCTDWNSETRTSSVYRHPRYPNRIKGWDSVQT